MNSLTSRLLLQGGVVVLVILVASSLTSYALVRGTLVSELDEFLRAKIKTFASLVENEHDDLELGFAENGGSEEFRSGGREYFQLLNDRGEILRRSPSLGDQRLGTYPLDGDGPTFHSAPLPDGNPGRFVATRFIPTSDGEDWDDDDQHEPDEGAERTLFRGSQEPTQPVTLVLARDVSGLEQSLATLRSTLTWVGVVAVLVSLLLWRWVVSRGLRPLRSIAASIDQVTEDTLEARVDEANAPREVRVIVRTLNGFIARLEKAFQREKTWSTNVAHELRTPLSGLRSTIEVALLSHDEPGPHQDALTDCLEICSQTQRVVESLLTLARADSGSLECCHEPIDLVEAVHSTWKPFQASTERRRLSVLWQDADHSEIEADRGLLLLLLRNVFDNAVTYTPEGGEIRISTTRDNGHIQLNVRNSGCKLADSDLERITDRFWRGDPSRSATGIHCGLGLALCDVVVGRIGGRMQLGCDANEEFSVNFQFPSMN